MNFARILIASTFVVVLAGCSSEARPGPGGGNAGGDAGSVESIPDPCTLVTKDDAAKAVGAAVSDGSSDLVSSPGMPTGRSCRYTALSGRGSLDMTIWPGGDELYEIYKEQEKNFGDIHDVSGVGDRAFRSGWIGLTFLKGEHLLTFGIELAKYDPDTAQANLKTLATASIARL